MTIDELNAELDRAKAARHPSFPAKYMPKSKAKDSGTNSLTAAIIAYVALRGGYAYRVNTMGTYREGAMYTDVMGNQKRAEGKWTKSGSTKGVADILAVVRGRALAIEVKFGRDTQSEAQRTFQAAFEAAGGTYIIAKTFDGFVADFKEFA